MLLMGKSTISMAIFNGKSMGKSWENGDLYGKIHHFEWENPLFRLGHFQLLCKCSPEGTPTSSNITILQSYYFFLNPKGRLRRVFNARKKPTTSHYVTWPSYML